MSFYKPVTLLLVILYLLTAITATLTQTDVQSITEQCASLLDANRPIPSGVDVPTIRITSPAQGEIIYGTVVAITVETQNFDLESDARHWHLWVNGELQGMVYQGTGVIDLAPGTYQLCASMGNADHADIGMPDGITFTVQQPAPGTPTPRPVIAPQDAPVLAEPGIEPVKILMIIGLGLGAAVGGWWLGSHLPNRRK